MTMFPRAARILARKSLSARHARADFSNFLPHRSVEGLDAGEGHLLQFGPGQTVLFCSS